MRCYNKIDFKHKYHVHTGYVDFMCIPQSKDGGPTLLPTLKYTKDLFYIAPLLHKEPPPDLEKLIMLDIDLEFK